MAEMRRVWLSAGHFACRKKGIVIDPDNGRNASLRDRAPPAHHPAGKPAGRPS